ncbi:MAG TPA: hypothetical protein VFK14_00230 [Solirubrobacterales bacterium]|nr:hypothetical protein [Solirubrobacterales bacterium]
MIDDKAQRPRDPEDRQDVLSSETWKGGEGKVTFNYLQQKELDTTRSPVTPLEAAGGTDIWGITK